MSMRQPGAPSGFVDAAARDQSGGTRWSTGMESPKVRHLPLGAHHVRIGNLSAVPSGVDQVDEVGGPLPPVRVLALAGEMCDTPAPPLVSLPPAGRSVPPVQPAGLRPHRDNRAVNVANAALYYYFTGKDAVLRSLVEPMIDAVDDLLADPPQRAANAENGGPLLTLYLQLLIRWRPVISFVVFDPAVRRRPELVPRLADQQSRLEAILAGADSGPAATVAASAAMGAVRRPVVRCEQDILAAHHDIIVDAAVFMGGGAQHPVGRRGS